MAISLTDVNPGTYSNLGDWLSVSGAGFQDPLIRIIQINVFCPESDVGVILTAGKDLYILSDSLMIVRGPSSTELSAKLLASNDYTSMVEINVTWDLLDDFGNVVEGGILDLIRFNCKWLPGVQSITFPNILWADGSARGTVTLNEPAAVRGDDVSVVQVPLLGVTNTYFNADRQDVTVEPSTVVITGQEESGKFTVAALQSAVPGDTFTIVSTPDPSLDPNGYYATATAVIGTPPIYLDLPRSFTDGTQVNGTVYVENPIAETFVRLAVDPPSPNPGIPVNPVGSGGEYTFTFTPSLPTTVTFNVTVTYGAVQQTFGPYICVKSVPIHLPPLPPPGRGSPV